MDKTKSPLYFKEPNDNRWHFNSKLAGQIRQNIPNYWEDTCPSCGNKENIGGCRCFLSHRSCSFCKTKWRWDIDLQIGKLCILIENGAVHLSNGKRVDF